MSASAHCPSCRATTTHQVVIRVVAERLVALRVCDGCSLEVRLPGLYCPSCTHTRTRVLYTRHPRAGVTRRVRECCSCGHLFRTREEIESLSADRQPRGGADIPIIVREAS